MGLYRSTGIEQLQLPDRCVMSAFENKYLRAEVRTVSIQLSLFDCRFLLDCQYFSKVTP